MIHDPIFVFPLRNIEAVGDTLRHFVYMFHHHYNKSPNQFIAEQFILISDTVQLKTASTLASVNYCAPWPNPSTPECLGPHMELLSGEPQERHPVQPAQFEIHSLWSQTC